MTEKNLKLVSLSQFQSHQNKFRVLRRNLDDLAEEVDSSPSKGMQRNIKCGEIVEEFEDGGSRKDRLGTGRLHNVSIPHPPHMKTIMHR